MQGNESWIAMFRRMPIDLHDVMAVGITTGDEIVLQRILKLEPEFMIILGRLAGTQDNGRLIIIAYAQLTYMAISRKLMDNEIGLIFGKDTEGFAAPIGAAKAQPNLGENHAAQDEAEAEVPIYEAPPAMLPNPAGPRGPMPSKTTLLAKLRERLGENGRAAK